MLTQTVSVFHQFTFSRGGGSRSNPSVSLGIQAAPDETLCFFISDECEVSAVPLAPGPGNRERTLQPHKLKAGLSEEVSPFWTSKRNICLVLGGQPAAECQQQQQGGLTHPQAPSFSLSNSNLFFSLGLKFLVLSKQTVT